MTRETRLILYCIGFDDERLQEFERKGKAIELADIFRLYLRIHRLECYDLNNRLGQVRLVPDLQNVDAILGYATYGAR